MRQPQPQKTPLASSSQGVCLGMGLPRQGGCEQPFANVYLQTSWMTRHTSQRAPPSPAHPPTRLANPRRSTPHRAVAANLKRRRTQQLQSRPARRSLGGWTWAGFTAAAIRSTFCIASIYAWCHHRSVSPCAEAKHRCASLAVTALQCVRNGSI